MLCCFVSSLSGLVTFSILPQDLSFISTLLTFSFPFNWLICPSHWRDPRYFAPSCSHCSPKSLSQQKPLHTSYLKLNITPPFSLCFQTVFSHSIHSPWGAFAFRQQISSSGHLSFSLMLQFIFYSPWASRQFLLFYFKGQHISWLLHLYFSSQPPTICLIFLCLHAKPSFPPYSLFQQAS